MAQRFGYNVDLVVEAESFEEAQRRIMQMILPAFVVAFQVNEEYEADDEPA
jgi:hypothetical protein